MLFLGSSRSPLPHQRGAPVAQEATSTSASAGLGSRDACTKLALPNDPERWRSCANVRLRETSPCVLRMDHDADQHDDRAIALAASKLLDRPVSGDNVNVHWDPRPLIGSVGTFDTPSYDNPL